MSLLQRTWSFLTFQNLPAAQITRAELAPLSLREANAQMQVVNTTGKAQWPSTDPATFDRNAYRKLALIFRCINVYANAVAEAPLKVYDQIDQQPQELPNHAFRQLLMRPNAQMGESTFWYNVAVRTAIYGFCVVEKERAFAGRPVGLWPMNSEWLKAIPRADAATDWEYKVPGHKAVVLPAEDVAVFRFAETGNGDPRGIGGLEVALREWGLLNTMQDFVKAFFDGGALPVYGLVPDADAELTQDEADVLRAKWMETTSWRNGAGSAPPIMKSIKDIKRLSFDYNELAYIDLGDVSEIHICQAFGIPGSLVGQRFAQERNTFTNYGEARQSFYEDTIAKVWTRFDDVMTRSVLPDLEYRASIDVRFDTSAVGALQEDQVAKRAHMLDAFKAGAAKRSDYRRLANLPVDEKEDDVYFMPFNVIEVAAGPQKRGYRSSLFVHEPRALAAGDRQSRGLVPMETRQRIETRAHRVYTNSARKFTAPLQDFFNGQKERVLGLAQRSTRAIADLVNVDWTAEDDELDKLIRQLWNLMGLTATEQANELLGLSSELVWDVANPWVREVLGEVATRVTNINETTRQSIAQVVNDALAEGTSIPDLSAKLSDLFDITYNGRAETVARTESQVAYNLAQITGYRESGLIAEVELLDNPDHGDYAGDGDGLTCAQRNGMIVPLESAQQHSLGTHPNCQIAIAPVISDLGVV